MLIEILEATHNITTLLFGIFISAFFLGVKQNRENILKLILFFCCDGLIFISLFFILNNGMSDNIYYIYPFVAHIPLVLFLVFYYKFSLLSSCVSMFSAYLCCQISNWGGLLIYQLTDNEYCYYFFRILITVTVFFLLCKYVCRTTASIFNKSAKVLFMIGFLPSVYYVLDYAFTKFSDLLYSGNKVVVEVYGFAFCIVYLVFLFVYFKEYEQRRENEQYGMLMEMQLTSIKNEAEQVRRNEQLMSIYRHDMRHHMNILYTLIQNGNTPDALNYLEENLNSYDNTAITRYCKNDLINSVISIYKIKFADKSMVLNCDIKFEILHSSEADFCAILSNALENAMHAIEGLSENKKYAKLLISSKGNSILLRLENPTNKLPKFIDGIPVSEKHGHGIGVKSIIYYVDKLHGQWHFSVSDGLFTMQIII